MRTGHKPTLREMRGLLRAMGAVIKRAEDLGQEELVDTIAMWKVNLAKQADLQRERERLRTRTKRRFGFPRRSTRPRLKLVRNPRPDK